MIRFIFLLEGMLSSIIGSIVGGTIAVILCLIQIYFGVIKLQGSGSFVVDAYPVEMRLIDFLLVGLTIISISALFAWLPAHRATNVAVVSNTN